MGTKISALTETGSAPGGSYLPLAYDGENYKIDAANLGAGSNNSPATSVVFGGYEVINSSTTWTAPAGTNLIWLTLVGAGAGGGAGYYNSANGAGGGGGGAIWDYFVNVVGGASYTITIGAGGTGGEYGGTNSYANGTAGTASVFEKASDASYFINCGGGSQSAGQYGGAGGALTTGGSLLPTNLSHLATGSTELYGASGSIAQNGYQESAYAQPGNGGDSGFPAVAAYSAGISTMGAEKASMGYKWPGYGRRPTSTFRSNGQNWGGAGWIKTAWAGYLGGGAAALNTSNANPVNVGGDGMCLIRTVSTNE